MAYYCQYREKSLELGNAILKEIGETPTVIIAGRSYIIYPQEVNLALPRKIISRGYNVVPYNLLPQPDNSIGYQSNVWAYTQQIYNSISYVKQNPEMYICFISCFSCGPDAIAYHYFRNELEGSTFCYLEIDSHTAHAGFDTRVGAFLDIIEQRHKKMV